MNPLKPTLILGLILISVLLTEARAEEPDDQRIIQHILATRAAILETTGTTNVRFMVFWDFDGTTLKGDCSEGLHENGHLVYAGLAQKAIEQGFSSLYTSSDGFERFWM